MFVILIVLMTSCGSKDSKTIKNALKNYVTKRSDNFDVKYKLKSYRIIDTITYGEATALLREKLPIVGEKVTLEEFKEQRNREFKEFRASYPNYENEVMRGGLKDASPWCTKIRIVTEKADSLMNVWPQVTSDSYDYNYLTAFYLQRMCQFYGMNEQYETAAILEKIEASKKDFDELAIFAQRNPSEIQSFKVEHEYSIYNPLAGKRIDLKDVVSFDKDWNYISDENMNNLLEFLK